MRPVDGAVGRVTFGRWQGCDVLVQVYWAPGGEPSGWLFTFSDHRGLAVLEDIEEWEVFEADDSEAEDFAAGLCVEWYELDEAKHLRRRVFRVGNAPWFRFRDWLRERTTR